MKRQLLAGLAVLLLLPLIVAAQGEPSAIVANIGFDFHANGKLMPAGVYELKTLPQEFVVSLTNQKTGATILLPVIATLGQKGENEASLVFDKVGDQYTLSELHALDMGGFEFAGVTVPHSHVHVRAGKR